MWQWLWVDSDRAPVSRLQVVLKYAFFCVQEMRQIETARQLVQYAKEVAPDLPEDVQEQIQELLELGSKESM